MPDDGTGESGGQGINVGDAILTFLGDMTQLDGAIDQVNATTQTKLAPAQAAAQATADAINSIGAAATTTAATTSSAYQAIYTEGMTYQEFTKANLAAALEFSSSSQTALKMVAASWQEIKVAAASAAAAQSGATGSGGGAAEEAAATDEAATKMTSAYLRVAEATLAYRNAVAQVNLVLKEMKETGDADSISMLRLAEAQKAAALAAKQLALAEKEAGSAGVVNFQEAKGAVMSLNHELGIGVDRHLAGWIAKLPGVGAALEAAFDAVMIFAIITLLIEGIEKLKEWEEQTEAVKREWEALDATMLNASSDMNEKIDQQKQKFIELTQGPVAAYDFALQHLKSTATDTLSSIKQQLDDQSKGFTDRDHWWDSAQWEKNGKAFADFFSKLNTAQAQARASAPGDVFAQYRAMADVSKKAIDDLDASIKRMESDNASAALAERGPAQIDLTPYYERLKVLKEINEQIKQGTELDKAAKDAAEQSAKQAAIAQAQQAGQAQIDADKKVGEARIALRDQQNQILLEQGRISYEKEFDLLRQSETDKYNLDAKALRDKIGLLQEEQSKTQQAIKDSGETSNTALNNALQKNKAAITAANGELKALALTHQASLLKIDQDQYKEQSSEVVAFWQTVIADTKEGSQERVDLEQGLADYLAMMWGEQSLAYLQQLARVKEARRAHSNEIKKIAQEEAQSEIALIEDRASAEVNYQQYLVQTFRASQATLLQLQRAAAVQQLQDKKQALQTELDQLGEDEVLKRTQINGKIALLDQQLNEQLRLNALQTTDDIESYYKELGITSVETLNNQADVAEVAFMKIDQSAAPVFEKLNAKLAYLKILFQDAFAAGNWEDAKTLQKQIDDVSAAIDRMGFAVNKTNILSNNFFDTWHKKPPQLQTLARQMGKTLEDMFNDIMAADANAVASFILSQDSLGHALRKATAQILAEYAARAAIEALYWTGYGFAMLAAQNYEAAADAFTAAAILGAFAGIAGGLAYAINPRDKGSANAGDSTSNVAPASGISQGSTSGTPPPPQTPHYATGALFTGPTMAVLGDALGDPSQTQGQREAALPLDNKDAMEAIGKAFEPYLKASSGGGIIINVEGLISDDNFHQLVKKIDRAVKNNDVQLTSTKSFKVLKKGG